MHRQYLLVVPRAADLAAEGFLAVRGDHVRGEGLGAREERRAPLRRQRALRLGTGKLPPTVFGRRTEKEIDDSPNHEYIQKVHS